MGMNLAAVRTGVKDALAFVDGLNVFDYQALRPQLPAAVVKLPNSIDPRPVFGNTHWNYELAIQLLIDGSEAAADDRLEQLLAEDGDVTTSVVAALRDDLTLGGACQSSDIEVINDFGWGEFNDGAVLWIGCTIVLSVMT